MIQIRKAMRSMYTLLRLHVYGSAFNLRSCTSLLRLCVYRSAFTLRSCTRQGSWSRSFIRFCGLDETADRLIFLIYTGVVLEIVEVHPMQGRKDDALPSVHTCMIQGLGLENSCDMQVFQQPVVLFLLHHTLLFLSNLWFEEPLQDNIAFGCSRHL